MLYWVHLVWAGFELTTLAIHLNTKYGYLNTPIQSWQHMSDSIVY
jgi:hypothetical protein